MSRLIRKTEDWPPKLEWMVLSWYPTLGVDIPRVWRAQRRVRSHLYPPCTRDKRNWEWYHLSFLWPKSCIIQHRWLFSGNSRPTKACVGNHTDEGPTKHQQRRIPGSDKCLKSDKLPAIDNLACILLCLLFERLVHAAKVRLCVLGSSHQVK